MFFDFRSPLTVKSPVVKPRLYRATPDFDALDGYARVVQKYNSAILTLFGHSFGVFLKGKIMVPGNQNNMLVILAGVPVQKCNNFIHVTTARNVASVENN